MDLAVMAATFGLLGLIALVTGALAARKGYRFFNWMFAGGIIGLLILCFLPFANAPGLPAAEQRTRAEKGNIIGRNISLVVVALAILRVIVE